MSQSFSAAIFKIGINPCVDVPVEISKAFGIRGNVPVRGTINGYFFRSTLVPVGEGRHRLYVNTEMRLGSKTDVGDTVDFTIEHDPEPRIPEMPKELLEALLENQLEQEFESLPWSRRKDILNYLNHLKTPEAIKHNVDKVIASLKND